MPDKTFIKAATSVVLHSAMEELKEVAIKHNKDYSTEYLDNMLLMRYLRYYH